MQFRLQSKESVQPLRRTMVMSSSLSLPECGDNIIQTTVDKGKRQADLHRIMETENYDQVRERVDELKRKLSDVNTKIDSVKSNINSHVDSTLVNSIRSIALHEKVAPRRTNSVVSTFNWSNTSESTSRSTFDWKKQPPGFAQGNSNPYTTQWGELSHYGDDPCINFFKGKPTGPRRSKK